MSADGMGVIRVNPPSRRDIFTIRLLICCGLASMVVFLYWFIDADHMGYAPIFWMLTFALAFKLLKMAHEWYHYWSPSVPNPPKTMRTWKVDMLTTACPGEPHEMIVRTLKAMQSVRYPHTSYLCDEGDDPELRRICKELGIVHVTRSEKVNAKAGNINNALRQATGEICVVLDPDHEPIPEFLDRVLPYFENDSVGFVQCVQGYRNQEESFVARGAAEQTYHFYGPMMMCMNTYGTAQAIGANCTFRRAALDSIGGHAAGLSEDMHTAMQLHAKGWRSVYIPEMLTRGLVPATLSAYYKQQLKWSRGTFELLFRVYPKLFHGFTWRQKLHYATLPFYFLYGLINLVDISVPLLALCLAEVPWEVNLSKFGGFFITLCFLSLLVRTYAQRWLLERHERGFHLRGGMLRTGTWWIFLIGFVYTIFRIRVPYIPTPKEDEPENCLRLSMPNLAVIAVCCLLVPYGLGLDYTPYSMAMAGYSALTAGILGVVVIASQQKLLAQVRSMGRRIAFLDLAATMAGGFSRKVGDAAYNILRNGTAVLVIAVSVIFLSYNTINAYGDERTFPEKELGGFYLGVNDGTAFASDLRQPAAVRAFDGKLGDVRPCDALLNSGQSLTIPYIRWNVEAGSDTLFAAITSGACDSILKNAARKFRSYKNPVLLSFAAAEHQAERVGSEQFVLAWQYLYTYFNSLGISNITWVWSPATATESSCYPGEKFVDWISIRCVSADGTPFTSLYAPFRKAYGPYRKPVMIASLGVVSGARQGEWFEQAFRAMKTDFREIHACVIGDEGRYTLSNGARHLVSSSITSLLPPLVQLHPVNGAGANGYRSNFIKGTAGHFTLQVKGTDWYMRGVAYNTAHDWRDGYMPLTRRQVEKDFARITAMGANTVRRYGTGIYDRNVLNIAHEYGLEVLYGFWFDPKIDFYADEEKVQEYMREVEEKVIEYRDHPGVLAWSVGNESWGLLKHAFAKPYLTLVRRSYAEMIEKMAQRIHQLDPSRPVFTCIEHEEYQIAGELVAFRDEAPSIDAIGVNSYYGAQISKLNHIAWQFDSIRPYFVSEFGPSGYWDPKYNRSRDGSVIEQTDREKADWYAYQWKSYVDAFRGNNIGGFAYCWRDRMEGSYTWFGLSDYKGRVKHSYNALRTLWTGRPSSSLPEITIAGPVKVKAGETYTYAIRGPRAENVHYEWMLLKNEYLDRMDGVEPLGDGTTAQVTIPEAPSDYRLYVFAVNDEEGWSSTASMPAKVRSEIP